MRKALIAFLVLGLLSSLGGQTVPSDVSSYTPEQLDELVAPIALYPDPLVALILPASTFPGDIVLAERYFEANGDPNQVDNQQWDTSVRALAHYPDVIKWMSDNLDWTTALGQAFLLEPTQVMESVQQLRAQARANGALVDTPQQTIVLDGSDIEIIPAQPDSIYIPQYDPDTVFIAQPLPYSSPIIIFGPPCWVGPWLDYECDWGQFGIWITVWRPGWDYVRDWRRPRDANNRGNYWRPDPVRQRIARYETPRNFTTPPHPAPMAGAPRPATQPAQRPQPAYGRYSSRPDTTGWRTDAQGHLAVTPAPASRSTGPQVVLSGTMATRSTQPPPPPANRPSSAPSRPRPEAPPPFNRPPPVPNQPAPSPPVNYPTSPFPAGAALPVAPNPGRPAPVGIPGAGPATGVLFGGYSRGTEARDFSNRGQASLQAAHPAPPAPRPAPTPRAAPAPPPPRQAPPSGPSSGGGNDNNQRKR